jgi:pimeloyl-ACP methyl ester carboxylesterase
MLDDKNIKRPLNLVAHGFITGQYAATWALKNPDAIAKLVLIDVPYSPEVTC